MGQGARGKPHPLLADPARDHAPCRDLAQVTEESETDSVRLSQQPVNRSGHQSTGHRSTSHRSASQPVASQPIAGHQSAGHQSAGHLVTGHPVAGQSVNRSPVNRSPVNRLLVSQSTGHRSPITGQPVTGQPVTGQPVTGQPVIGHPVTGHPVTGHPVTGHPVTGQPVIQEVTGQPDRRRPASGHPQGDRQGMTQPAKDRLGTLRVVKRLHSGRQGARIQRVRHLARQPHSQSATTRMAVATSPNQNSIAYYTPRHRKGFRKVHDRNHRRREGGSSRTLWRQWALHLRGPTHIGRQPPHIGRHPHVRAPWTTMRRDRRRRLHQTR